MLVGGHVRVWYWKVAIHSHRKLVHLCWECTSQNPSGNAVGIKLEALQFHRKCLIRSAFYVSVDASNSWYRTSGSLTISQIHHHTEASALPTSTKKRLWRKENTNSSCIYRSSTVNEIQVKRVASVNIVQIHFQRKVPSKRPSTLSTPRRVAIKNAHHQFWDKILSLQLCIHPSIY